MIKKVIVISLILIVFFIAIELDLNLCLFKNVLGIPCPGCGMTRAFLALTDLNFRLAFSYHPLFIIPIIIFIILFLHKKKYLSNVQTNMITTILAIISIALYIFRIIIFFPTTPPMDFNETAIIPYLIK